MRGEEGVCVVVVVEEAGGEAEREEEDVWKTGSSGRIAGRAPVTEEAPAFCHRLLPFFFFFFPSVSFVRQQEGHPKGKERVLKIPPSFLCPSPLLKTCRLHSNRPWLHTELIQSVVVNVWGRESELLLPLCVSVCVSVCLCSQRKRMWLQQHSDKQSD